MAEKKNILLISSHEMNPCIIHAMEQDGYTVIPGKPGTDSIDDLGVSFDDLVVIILDVDQPIQEEEAFLRRYHSNETYSQLPLIVVSGDDSQEAEEACLKYGAWDYIKRTSFSNILRLRINNAIKHSTLPLVRQLQHVIDFDRVSGIYNKEHFFTMTRKMLDENPDKKFALVHFDIEKFRLINSFFGSDKGDEFIVYIAQHLKRYGRIYPHFTYGHIGADVFAFCMNFDDETELTTLANRIRNHLKEYPLPFTIIPVLGIAIIENNSDDINTLFDKANLASKSCHGNFLKHYAFYEDKMNVDAIRDQFIVNNMVAGLEKKQFVIYLQPKYDLRTNLIDGAEALVRWNHPDRGMIPPNEFIPVFERNGFISHLDYYVWDGVCQMLRRWIDEGKTVCPISVNISRVDLFNPHIVDIICNLVEKYDLPPQLLQLELTESAYTSNPFVIKEMMGILHEKGFTVLMDDFGTGYSSLNVLKDIVVDILKIDMRFMTDCDTPGRGENILGSIVRMAKWLDLPVIAEGVETKSQIEFLRNIGCEFIQGYYFAKPMPMEEFEKLAFTYSAYVPSQDGDAGDVSADTLWSVTSQLEALFSNILQAMAIYEFDGTNIEILRGNDAYHTMFGYPEGHYLKALFTDIVSPTDWQNLLDAFKRVSKSHSTTECEIRKTSKGGSVTWLSVKLKYFNTIGDKDIGLFYLTDITSQKIIDRELQKYRTALSASASESRHMLIIDDEEVNRVILANIFEKDFVITQAENARQGLEVLQDGESAVDLILLDLAMPEMNGVEFLHHKMNTPSIADIPVIIITADDSSEQQSRLLDMGVKDYIVKPFVPAVVQQRVTNVIESIRRVGEKLQHFK